MYFGAIYGWYFYLTWLPTYLLRARGFDLTQVGWLAALPLLAIAGGVLLGGWASDRLARRFGAARRAARARRGRASARRLAIVGAVSTPSAAARGARCSPPRPGSRRSASRRPGRSASRSAGGTPAS